MPLKNLKKELKEKSNEEKANVYQRFFKTGKGEYGEGDIFLGLTVPEQRKIAGKYSYLKLDDLKDLLKSKIHEERLIALLILVDKYKKEKNGKEFFDFYIENLQFVNNWDLVDLSADKIIGNFLRTFRYGSNYLPLLTNMAKSENLWARRISIISTFDFIKNNEFNPTIKISEILLNDSHDLIHKAVGWMLREIGKRDLDVLEDFLKKHHKEMPRTMLRYAIEKFPEEKRKKYLDGKI